MARIETCEEAAKIHALLQYTELMPEDSWTGSEVKRISGALIHDIFMQLIGSSGLSLICSFMQRGMNKSEAILKTLDILYKKSSWFSYISSLVELENGEPLSQLIIKEFISYKNGIVKLAQPLISIHNKEVIPVQFEDEVYITYPISLNFTIAGKIDLLFTVSDKIFIIDLKTGRENPNNHLQVQLYTEIIKQQYPEKEVIGQIWYLTRDNPIIETVTPTNSLLLKLEHLVETLPAINSVDILTRNQGKRKDCYYCKLCDYAKTLLSTLLPITISAESDNFESIKLTKGEIDGQKFESEIDNISNKDEIETSTIKEEVS